MTTLRCTGCVNLEDDDGTLRHAIVNGCPVHDAPASALLRKDDALLAVLNFFERPGAIKLTGLDVLLAKVRRAMYDEDRASERAAVAQGGAAEHRPDKPEVVGNQSDQPSVHDVPTDARPDFKRTYDEEWRDIIEPDGLLSIDALMRELHDYSFLMRQASEVYCEVTGNRLSKTTYLAASVISVFNEKLEGWIEEAVKEASTDSASPDPEDPCICGHRRGWHDLNGFQGCDAASCECVSFARTPTHTWDLIGYTDSAEGTSKQREGRAFEEGFKAGVENEKSLTDQPSLDALGCAHCATRYFQVLGDLSVVCFHGHYRGVLQPVGVRGRDDDPLVRAVAHMASAKATPGPAVSDYFPLTCACSEVMRRDGVHGASCPLYPRRNRRPDGFLARNDVNLWKPAEHAIQAAVDAVEATGASTALTDAVILLTDKQRGLLDAARAVVEGCDLHRSDYSSVEWAALSKLREAVAVHTEETPS